MEASLIANKKKPYDPLNDYITSRPHKYMT